MSGRRGSSANTKLAAFLREERLSAFDVAYLSGGAITPQAVSKWTLGRGGMRLGDALVLAQSLRPRIESREGRTVELAEALALLVDLDAELARTIAAKREKPDPIEAFMPRREATASRQRKRGARG